MVLVAKSTAEAGPAATLASYPPTPELSNAPGPVPLARLV